MNLPVVRNSPTRLLLFLLTWMCALCGSAKRNLEDDEYRYGESYIRTECSDYECFSKTRTFNTYPFGCYSDKARYKIFSDCCPDYERKCGRIKLVAANRSAWKCIKHHFLTWEARTSGSIGVWMISKCPANFGCDELRRKCENAPANFSYPLEETIPVVAAKGETYRNWFCALCNGVKNYTSWDFKVSVEPPNDSDMDSQLKVVLSKRAEILYIGPKFNQPIRFCFERNFVDNCVKATNPSRKACVEGPVEVVLDANKNITYFKNSACATCHGSHNITLYRVVITLRLNRGDHFFSGILQPTGFSIVYKRTKLIIRTTKTTSYCPAGTVYDPVGSYALKILTLVGFSVSIICLMLLMITYGLFRELRTVPGMNLMNLSSSMLLSHLLWLIGGSYFTGAIACKGFAIVEHYLFQVSFLAMSVISYHSCYVFSQPFAGRDANNSCRRFIKYSAFVWLTPAVFVAICVTLDETETFLVDYGTDCWMGNFDAKLYLFLLPLAVLLLYNIITFIRTAVSLHRHDSNRVALQRNQERQNLIICAKLATLVGFPWLFAFIGLIFPDEEVFEYLFVVFVCLQGLYIGMAFLFTKKTLKLYKDGWDVIFMTRTPTYAPPPAFEMT